MYLKSLELTGFKSFAKKSRLEFGNAISGIVGPNGSGKSNIAEAFRFALGEQSIKSLRGKRGEDLIWNGSAEVPRANRAGVMLVFNNERRLLDIDFDEVTIERVVHRDGVNTYAINGTEVRLRDVLLLLAGANIGSSGHHIISQGEADRVLSAHPKERREMIEDALGLKVYQYKKRESEKRLAKCEENITHVESLRKEIAPHLRFLGKQAEKVEKSRVLRDELRVLYREYLIREALYIDTEKEAIIREKKEPEARFREVEEKLAGARKTLERSKTYDEKSKAILSLEKELRSIREEKEALSHDLGRVEGQIVFEERHKSSDETASHAIPLTRVLKLYKEIDTLSWETERENTVIALKSAIKKIRDLFEAFIGRERGSKNVDTSSSALESDLPQLKKERKEMEQKRNECIAREVALEKEYLALQREIEAGRSEERSAERAIFAMREEQNALRAALTVFSARQAAVSRAEDDRKREVTESMALCGHDFTKNLDSELFLNEHGADITHESREKQEARWRELEKMKIRLEEFGGGSGEEIMKEYRELMERDEFLTREIADLHTSTKTLLELITDLDEKLTTKFKEGIITINKEFQNFFALMFGGGTAALSVSFEQKRKSIVLHDDLSLLDETGEESKEDEADREAGVDIAVSLPKKRIKGLQMLSGGERALTSIALLFAISAVNPPPFLVLDETDAALDEANSRRYGDMIENLSKYSQLILITHNRETMSRAGILYGVTMGSAGVSKLLSVSFDEAVTVAK